MKSPSSCRRLALQCWHLALACLVFLFLFAVRPADAAGVAALKEQPFHSDNLAKPLVYLSMSAVSPQVWKINTGKQVMTVDASKVADFVEIPSTFPAEIATEKQAKPLRDFVARLNAFTKKYPKCEPTLREHVESYSGHLAKFDQGMIRQEAKWITKAELAEMERKRAAERVAAAKKQEAVDAAAAKRAEKEATAKAKKQEAERAAAEKRRKVEEAYAASQRAKGLEYYDDAWRPAADVATRKERKKILDAAYKEVDSRSIRNANYMALQVVEGGLLISVLNGESNKKGVNTTVALLTGVDTRGTADGDGFRSDLYWSGTRTYDLGDGDRPTIHTYCLERQAAADAVIKRQKEGAEQIAENDDTDSAERKPDESGRRDHSKANDILAGYKGTGSAFFVGSEGYLITNEHVVQNAKTVDIHYQDRLVTAQVVKVSKAVDLALLKIEEKVEGLPIVEAEAKLGTDVFAIGYPVPTLQGIGVKVTKGIISGDKGVDEDATRFQIDAAIQPGNSGGALCDSAGNLVGVSVAVLDVGYAIRESGTLPQNVNYAIKAGEVLAFLRTKEIAVTTIKPGAEAATNTTDAMQKALKATVLVIRR